MPDRSPLAIPPDAPIAVLGAGSWGTALAYSLAAGGNRRVHLWARRQDHADAINAAHRNEAYLPNAPLPERVVAMADLHEAVAGAPLWVFATPSQTVRQVAGELTGVVTPEHLIVSAAKGIENDTLCRTSQVLCDVLTGANADRIGVLYGPSHAEEVALGQPTSIVAAVPDHAAAHAVQDAFMTDKLRVYVNTDLVGVEIAGSVKNVMALAAGISDGVGLGDNAKAALVTRGLAEIKRLGRAMGADPMTFAGLAGLGDLVVTCFSRHSRNRYFGEQIGQGRSVEEVEREMTMVAEGVRTTISTRQLARREGVEMPITEAVHAILFEGLSPQDAVCELMTRAAKREENLAFLLGDG